MIEPLLLMALLTGLLGSGHCIGMCGPIVGALSLSCHRIGAGLSFQLMYNCGRVMTYTLVGTMAGLLGSVLAFTNAFHGVMRLALLLSDLFIIVVGLGTLGMFSRINIMRLEFPAPVKALTAMAARLSKLPASLAALPLGMVMGFLPCGFLYAMVITATQSADPVQGGLMLLAFGLGTMPAIFLFGSAAQWLGTRVRTWLLRSAGGLVVVMGLINLSKHIEMLGWDLAGPLQFLCH